MASPWLAAQRMVSHAVSFRQKRRLNRLRTPNPGLRVPFLALEVSHPALEVLDVLPQAMAVMHEVLPVTREVREDGDRVEVGAAVAALDRPHVVVHDRAPVPAGTHLELAPDRQLLELVHELVATAHLGGRAWQRDDLGVELVAQGLISTFSAVSMSATFASTRSVALIESPVAMIA